MLNGILGVKLFMLFVLWCWVLGFLILVGWYGVIVIGVVERGFVLFFNDIFGEYIGRRVIKVDLEVLFCFEKDFILVEVVMWELVLGVIIILGFILMINLIGGL